MGLLCEMIHEQFVEYTQQLIEDEKEIIRKYNAGEDCDVDIKKASGLKLLQAECVIMLKEKHGQ